MRSNWPDHTPHADERRRSPIGLIIVLGVAAGAYLYLRDHTPNVDLRGLLPAPAAEQPAEPPPPSITEALTTPEAAPLGDDGSTTTRQAVPFDACVNTITRMQDALSAKPEVLEDSAERRAIRLSAGSSSVTITCSAADQTMTISREE
jgi:hypothetical protein